MRGNQATRRPLTPTHKCVNTLCKLTAKFTVKNDEGDFVYSCSRHLAYNCEVMALRPGDPLQVRWLAQ